jgi:hypothetical protein
VPPLKLPKENLPPHITVVVDVSPDTSYDSCSDRSSSSPQASPQCSSLVLTIPSSLSKFSQTEMSQSQQTPNCSFDNSSTIVNHSKVKQPSRRELRLMRQKIDEVEKEKKDGIENKMNEKFKK